MKHDTQTITVESAHLIIGYLHNSLTESEKGSLDNWICLSDKNMGIFCQLTDKVDDNIFNPDDLIVNTENIIDLWIIASLIVRRKMKLNSKVEDRYLDEWQRRISKTKNCSKITASSLYAEDAGVE